MDMQHSLSYDIDLSGEPSGISAYMVLPDDTTQESQNLGLMVERLCSECAIAARVRQYYGGNREDFYDLLDWTSLNVSVDNELTISVDKAAVQAGGKTILELKMTSSNSLPFVSGAKVVLTNPWTIQTLLVPQNHVATICDGGDDYRFDFNGQEKVNEIAGLGNHNTALFGELDTRIGRRWNLDPKPNPSMSLYSVFNNSPIWHNDLLLDTPSARRMVTSAWTISVQTNVDENANVLAGHSWIKLVNLKNGEIATYSLWGNKGQKEFLKNAEKGYSAVTNRTLFISNDDYKKLYNFSKKGKNVDWTLTNTCAGFSSEAWEVTTGESLNSTNIFGWTVPAILAGSITQKNGNRYSNTSDVKNQFGSSVGSSAESSNSNSSSSSGSNGSDSGSSTSSSSSGCIGAGVSGSAGTSIESCVGGGGTPKDK